MTVEVPAPAAGVLPVDRRQARRDGECRRRPRCHRRRRCRRSGGRAAQDRSACRPASRPAPSPAAAKPRQPQPLSPAVRKIVEERSIDASGLDRHRQGGAPHQGRLIDSTGAAAKVQTKAPTVPSVTPSPAPQLRAPARPAETAREERVKMTRLAPDHRPPSQGCPEHRRHAHHLQRGRHDARSWRCATAYKEVFEKKHGVKLGFMGFFVKACVQALQGRPGGQCRDRRRRHRLQATTTISASPSAPTRGLVVPVVRDADRLSFAGIEKTIAEFGKQGPRRPAQDRGHAGWHLHHLQWRRLRLADVDADPQCAAVGHPRHAQDPGAAGGGGRRRSSSAR